jgi:hypothetical protein
MLLLRTTAVLLLAALMTACAVPMRISLPPEQRAAITDLKAHVVVIQDEVLVAVHPSNVSAALGGGLIPALIDSSITNTRVKATQEIMGPFYAAIEDVDYRREFNEAVHRELSRYPIKVGHVTTTPRSLSQADLMRMRSELERGQALLVVYPRYFLTMDFRSLDVEAVVTIWTKDGQGNTPAQRGVLYYQSQPIGSGNKDSVARWAAQNAAAFRAALRESIVETLELVMMDMNVPLPSAQRGEIRSYAFNTGAQQMPIKGQLVKETANRVIVLGEDAKLYSLPKDSSIAATAAQ